MNIKRLKAIAAAFFMTMLLCVSCAQAVTVDDVVVVSAPLRRSTTVLDGMVRVWLKSIGSVSSLDVTVTGSYSVNGNTAFALSDGDTVQINFDTSTGAITFVMNDTTYAVSGDELRLRRHQAEGESALSIAQAPRPSNLYLGDLQLLSVEQSDGSFRLYPIVHVYLEYYLYGVVPYEMSSSNPVEALKAQAVAARTYTLRLMNGNTNNSYDLGDTSAWQVYKGYTGLASNATKAVDETKGIIIMNGSGLTGTYYTASNGGQTESVKNAWGNSSYSYLKVKDDPFDALNTGSSRKRLTVYEDFDHESQNATFASILTSNIQEELGETAVIQTINSITPHTPKYAAPSRLYTLMDIGVTALVDDETLQHTLTLSIFDDLEAPLSMSLNSGKNELWTAEKLEDGFRLTAARWGHGIGMSQRGAQQMAKMSYTYDQILGFYYEGCERVQYTFTHTILSAGSSSSILETESPAEITPALENQATVALPGANDVAPLRYTAEESGVILTGIPNGGIVTVLSKGEDWSLVQYGEINGYLPNTWLVFTDDVQDTEGATATSITGWGGVTNTNALNFRSEAAYGDNVITELSSGTILCILATEGDWVKVQYGTMIGYVSPQYLTIYTEYPGETNADTSAMVSLDSEGETASLLVSPSTGATVIARIAHGTQVTVLTNDGSWCYVDVAGVKGYLLTSQLDFDATGTTPDTPPATEGITAVVNTDADTLNLRSGPSTSDDIIAQIPKGTTIVVTTYGEEWCAVTWGDLEGYVMTKYLLFESTGDSDDSTGDDTESSDGTDDDAETEVTSGTTAWVMRTVNYVNLREAASTAAEIITTIPAGDELTVLESGATFSYVQHGVGNGYVLSEHLTYTEPVETIGILYVNTQTDPLAMRDEADRYDSVILTYVPKGAKVLLIEELVGWCQVQYGDYIGYCASEYLSHTRPTEYEEDDTPIYDPTLAAVTGWSAVINTGDDSLSLKEWCAADSPELTTVPGGNTVELLAMGDIWCKITFEGETGYCLTRDLILLAPTAE